MEELKEELTTAQMATRAGVTRRTVQRWIKNGELHATAIRSGYYAINPLDLVELSLPLRADTTPKEKRLSYDELFDTVIEVKFDLDDLQYRLGQAEDKIERLNRRIAELTRKPTTTTTRRKKRDTRKLLPYDYTPWRAFARLHGIPESTVERAIKEQTLYVERGNWKFGSRTITEAFDDYECELFYEHFRAHLKFKPCEDCPHKRY
ncbi:MAG: helix-turn-helix domain-containing protein [Ktedonobacteraceae bacterium]